MKNFFILTLAALALSGCATQKDWAATGGSKSDGTIKLSYEVGLFQVAEVSEAQAISLAKRRCSVWGYTGAEAFGGSTKACNQASGGSCNSWLITKEYQCTDN